MLLHVATDAPSRVDAMVIVSAAPRFPDQTRATMLAAVEAEHTRCCAPSTTTSLMGVTRLSGVTREDLRHDPSVRI
jgi:hypothetical protein